MRDFRDKGRKPRFNRNAPNPPRRNSPTVQPAPRPAPAPVREYQRADADPRETRRSSSNDREIVYGVEPIRELVAAALVNKGAALGALGRGDEAVAVYDDLVARFGTATELPLREQVAKVTSLKNSLRLQQAD